VLTAVASDAYDVRVMLPAVLHSVCISSCSVWCKWRCGPLRRRPCRFTSWRVPIGLSPAYRSAAFACRMRVRADR
jgi:hypothetical protein